MAPIRVVLGTMPPLLGDIVRETLARDAEVEIIAEVEGRADIPSAVERASADVAVLGVHPAEWVGLSGLLRDLLADHPRLKIIALANDGRSGYVYQLQPRAIAIDDISPRSLVQAIRSSPSVGVHPPIHPFSAE